MIDKKIDNAKKLKILVFISKFLNKLSYKRKNHSNNDIVLDDNHKLIQHYYASKWF